MLNKQSKFIVGLLVSIAVFSCAIWINLRPTSLWDDFGITFDIRIKSSLVRPLDVKGYGMQTDFECVNAKVGNLSFPMCLYDSASDKYISAWVRKKDYFEANFVMKVINFFKTNVGVTFLDLGANLGIYSLPIAHSKIRVVSVEASKETVRRLAKSIYLGKIAESIDLFHYAVSNETSTTYLKFDSTNRGDTFMVGNGSCPGCLSVDVITLDYLIPFVRNKRVFIKVDIQGAEIKVFTRVGAGKFFSEFDVVMVQMEWGYYPLRYAQEESKRRQVNHFLEFFYQRGYDVYDPVSEKRLGSDWIKWPFDVTFKRTELAKDKLYQI